MISVNSSFAWDKHKSDISNSAKQHLSCWFLKFTLSEAVKCLQVASFSVQLKGLACLFSSIFLSPQSQNSRRWVPVGLHRTGLDASGVCCQHWLGSRSLARSGAGSSLDTQMEPDKIDWGRAGPGGSCCFLTSDLDVSFIVRVKCKRVKGKVFTLLVFGLRQGDCRLMGREERKGCLVKVFPIPQWAAEVTFN